MAVPPNVQDPLLGVTIDGRYRVVKRIARGGMATVYRSQDERLDRAVAIKVLHPHLAEGQEFIDRFRREARAAAKLIHPGIVAVYDQGTWGDSPYLVMELVEGTNLRGLLTNAGLPPVGKALDLVAQVLDALALAHNAGFVHRDVKPENILISSTGQVKVADFGLARAVSEVTAASSGVVLGTVAYLSPELVAEGVADARADVYAAGVVLFELLTGRQPFVGEAPIQVAFQHVHAAFPAPSGVVDWLGEAIDALVAALTAKRPDDRPNDAAAALALVRQVRRELPDAVAQRRPDPPPLPPSPAKKAGRAGRRKAAEAAAAEPADPTAAEGQSDIGTGLPGATPAKPDGPDEVATDDLPTDRPGHSTGGTQLLPLATVPPGGRNKVEPTLPGGDGIVQPRRRRKVIWRFLFALLAVVLLAGGASVAWYFAAGPGAKVEVPVVVGLTQSEAEAALQRHHLTFVVTNTFSDTEPAGRVMEASPPAGTKLAKQEQVQLLVSSGIEHKTVPTSGIVGAELAAAKAGLLAAGLDGEVTPVPVWDTEVPQGTVLAIEPEGGQEVPHNQPITLKVSDGPEPVLVPDLEGLTFEQAKERTDPLDLTLEKGGEESSETVPEGQIIRQNPANEANSFRGESVSVWISTGLPFVEVPQLFGKPFITAEAELKRLGFVVERQNLGTGMLGFVQQQSLEAGSFHRKGTTITLTVV